MKGSSIFMCNTSLPNNLKINVEHGRVVTTLNIIKHLISYFVYLCYLGRQKTIISVKVIATRNFK
jgi:hypothetical protein